MFNPADIQKGMMARDRDGEILGLVIAVDPKGFTIEKGKLFARDVWVSFSDVMDRDGDDVYLNRDLASLPDALRKDLTERRGSVKHSDLPRDVPLSHDLTGGLGLSPRDLEEARMDSAKFQDHHRYHVGPGEGHASESDRAATGGRERLREERISDTEPTVVAVQQPPFVVERRVSARDEEDATVRREAPTDRDPDTRR